MNQTIPIADYHGDYRQTETAPAFVPVPEAYPLAFRLEWTFPVEHDVELERISFQGACDGTKITSLDFGGWNLWSDPVGLPLVMLTPVESFLRGLVKRTKINKGTTVTFILIHEGETPPAVDLVVELKGRKVTWMLDSKAMSVREIIWAEEIIAVRVPADGDVYAKVTGSTPGGLTGMLLQYAPWLRLDELVIRDGDRLISCDRMDAGERGTVCGIERREGR